jgi:hypothetical protein
MGGVVGLELVVARSPQAVVWIESARAGFQFAYGSKVTTLAGGLGEVAPATVAESALGQEPDGPLLVPRGGGGGGQSWSHRLWLWPLPEEGPLSFVCEWPGLGIALTRTGIDLEPIRGAAGRSRLLWEDDRAPYRAASQP